ncbi:hypothetical protein GBZ48_04510 [Azospirillum melinis]|uniref:Uncharacterized protein n=1 Tax=Azospirillum melinis TaxID=328839 RepID=A0ABX2K7K7_9PROT|nr:hypothetical protein [Azospirillum melinis]
MRQACEISALREDLERLAHEAGALRDGVEQAVETVRDRFAALTAEEMADPMVLAPLLQLAVTTLLEIREQARQLNTQTGPLSDDERPSWLGAADAPRLRQPAAIAQGVSADEGMSDGWGGDDALERSDEPLQADSAPPPSTHLPARLSQPALALPASQASPSPGPLAPALSQVAAVNPSSPASRSSASAARTGEGQASWLASEPAPPPPPSRAATVRATASAGPRPKGGIDWLGPAGR